LSDVHLVATQIGGNGEMLATARVIRTLSLCTQRLRVDLQCAEEQLLLYPE